jgi:hypothetical protein
VLSGGRSISGEPNVAVKTPTALMEDDLVERRASHCFAPV